TGGVVRKSLSLMMGGFFLCIIGYINLWKLLFGVSIGGHIIFTVGLLLMAIGIWRLPNLAELDWKIKINTLYVITRSGVCIYERSFQSGEKMDSLLVSGGLTGVITIVSEMTKSDKKLNTIQQEGRNVLLAYGDYCTVALIADEDLEILHDKIRRLRIEIESLFMDVLPGWDGDLGVFKPIKVLVDKTFSD
ncbi:MAG: hypothetical protein ACFFCS_26325, partial [Candidatus Hodarchaeota archaeon]